VAIVLTLIQIRINIHTRNNTKKNTKHSNYKHTLPKHPHITKLTHSHTHTLRNKLKQPQYKLKRTQYQINKHTPHHFTSLHFTPHHFTYLHPIPTWIPLLVITSLTLFLKVFSFQRKDAMDSVHEKYNKLMGYIFEKCFINIKKNVLKMQGLWKSTRMTVGVVMLWLWTVCQRKARSVNSVICFSSQGPYICTQSIKLYHIAYLTIPILLLLLLLFIWMYILLWAPR